MRITSTASYFILTLALATLFADAASTDEQAYLGNGIKIGEVTSTSAIIWTRLTAKPDCPPPEFKQPGSEGRVVLTVTPLGDGKPVVHEANVDPEHDCAHQFKLTDLRPDTSYWLRLAVDGQPRAEMHGHFTTAPVADQPADVSFVVTTGHKYATIDEQGKGQRIYRSMLDLQPSFFVHTGDIVYYDGDVKPLARSVPEARLHWHRMYALPNQIEFHRQVPSYFIKDDHDTLKNDCWPGQSYGDLTFAQGQALFREQVPMGEKTYRTVRWGKDLQIWLPEGRDFRSPNKMPDGPDKTIWGKEQIDWFKRTVDASDAAFKIVVNATPIVGPDRARGKNDNHANDAFAHEGRMLRRFMADREMVVCNGDRHWQYHSVDEKTGLNEFSCGPSTNRHSGGWNPKNKTDAHRFLRVRGGFLSVDVQRIDGQPTATFRHHDVDGKVVNEVRMTR